MWGPSHDFIVRDPLIFQIRSDIPRLMSGSIVMHEIAIVFELPALVPVPILKCVIYECRMTLYGPDRWKRGLIIEGEEAP